MNKNTLYAEIRTDSGRYDGIFPVKEVLGSIVAVEIEDSTVDFCIWAGELKRFCTADGKNFKMEIKSIKNELI